MSCKCLADSYGRRIDYLRVSVTQDCNFRCVYCMPKEGFSPVPVSHHLSVDDIIRFVTISASLGITKVRLTGGEPLLHKGILEIVRRIRAIPEIQDLSITTNGSLLEPLIEPLKDAGLDRLNISLDSLDPERFREVTLSKAYDKVLRAVSAALRAGFPVKLNMVAIKGLSRDEIIKFVKLACHFPLDVRFLEFMPLCGTGWRPDLVVPIREIRAIVMENFTLTRATGDAEVAESYEIENAKGRVGFIASLTESFCDTCSRIRLTADGKIFPCLFSPESVDVKSLLASRASDEDIACAIRQAVKIKPEGNRYFGKPFDMTCKDSFENIKMPAIRTLGG